MWLSDWSTLPSSVARTGEDEMRKPEASSRRERSASTVAGRPSSAKMWMERAPWRAAPMRAAAPASRSGPMIASYEREVVLIGMVGWEDEGWGAGDEFIGGGR